MKIEHDDYIWDGTGDPDPEIRELENILGSLRHKGNAPKLPVRPRFVYRMTPMLAIAASMLLVLGAGVWVGIRLLTKDQGNKQVAAVAPVPIQPTNAVNPPVAQPVQDNQNSVIARDRNPDTKVSLPRIVHAAYRGMTAQEIKKGKEAKAQLMLAMQITSSTLNQARKKIHEDSRQVKS